MTNSVAEIEDLCHDGTAAIAPRDALDCNNRYYPDVINQRNGF
jgi:hypothetical protein